MALADSLTVVMYHYVRPIAGSAYERIKGLELTGFRAQLDHIQRDHTVVSARQLVEASRGGAPLPGNALILTFDDGYADHYRYVYPELQRRGMSGLFFPAAQAVKEGVLLDVNKVHFLLACAKNLDELVAYIEQSVDSARAEFDLQDLQQYRDQYFKANRFDSPQVIYIKRMLQAGLPKTLRSRIAKELFSRYVSVDECAFARELYMTPDDIGQMAATGMEIGSHGYAHYWLNTLEIQDQKADIAASLDFLDSVGVSREDFFFCYPYGAYNKDTLTILRQRGCAAAFTTRVARMESIGADLLEVPRLDTNDLPQA